MSKKRKTKNVFPTVQKTEFARFSDPDDFSFDPDLPEADADTTFFRNDTLPPERNGNGYN